MVKSSTITHIIVTHWLQRKEEKGAENTWTSIHIENCFNMYIEFLNSYVHLITLLSPTYNLS